MGDMDPRILPVAPPPPDDVWVYGELVPKANLGEFLKSKRCAWRHIFRGPGAE